MNQLGSSAVGIRTDEGVVLVVEKKGNSELMESIAFEKLCEVDRNYPGGLPHCLCRLRNRRRFTHTC